MTEEMRWKELGTSTLCSPTLLPYPARFRSLAYERLTISERKQLSAFAEPGAKLCQHLPETMVNLINSYIRKVCHMSFFHPSPTYLTTVFWEVKTLCFT
jgi:hypothetical protein